MRSCFLLAFAGFVPFLLSAQNPYSPDPVSGFRSSQENIRSARQDFFSSILSDPQGRDGYLDPRTCPPTTPHENPLCGYLSKEDRKNRDRLDAQQQKKAKEEIPGGQHAGQTPTLPRRNPGMKPPLPTTPPPALTQEDLDWNAAQETRPSESLRVDEEGFLVPTQRLNVSVTVPGGLLAALQKHGSTDNMPKIYRDEAQKALENICKDVIDQIKAAFPNDPAFQQGLFYEHNEELLTSAILGAANKCHKVEVHKGRRKNHMLRMTLEVESPEPPAAQAKPEPELPTKKEKIRRRSWAGRTKDALKRTSRLFRRHSV